MKLLEPFRRSLRVFRKPRGLALAGLLLALQVVLDVYLSLYVTPTVKVSFGFLAIGLSGAVLGPVPAMAQAVAADIIGHFLKPFGAYFPGYSLTALLNGAFYGFILYEKKPGPLRALCVKAAVNLLLNILLNTLWSVILTKTPFWTLLPARALKNIIALPIEAALLWGVWFLGLKLLIRMGLKQELDRIGKT